MKRVIKLTEQDLEKVINKLIEEQVAPKTAAVTPSQAPKNNDRITNIVNILNSLTPQTVQVIKSNNPNLNGMTWGEYVKKYKITMQEIAQANQMRKTVKSKPKSPQVKPVVSGTTAQTQVKPVVSGSKTPTTTLVGSGA